MHLFVKFVLIVCLFVVVVTRPVQQSKKLTRAIRQVVQPSWLNIKTDMTNGDGKVRVTNESLLEAEQLRKSIQGAVDAGVYVHETPSSIASNTTFTPTMSGNLPSNMNLFETPPSTTSWGTFLGNMNDFFTMIFQPLSLGSN